MFVSIDARCKPPWQGGTADHTDANDGRRRRLLLVVTGHSVSCTLHTGTLNMSVDFVPNVIMVIP
jgi:hypothetical protein